MRYCFRMLMVAVMALVVGAAAWPAQAQLLSVDICNQTQYNSPEAANSTNGVWKSDHWNADFSYGQPDNLFHNQLIDSSGQSTNIGYALSGSATVGIVDGWTNGTNTALVSDGAYTESSSGSAWIKPTITGLDPSASYNVIVYIKDGQSSGGLHPTVPKVNGVAASTYTGSVNNTDLADATVNPTGGDYYYFDDVALDTSNNLVIDATRNGGYPTIAGFQVQTAVPVPSSIILACLGMLMIVICRRRRTV